MVLAILFVCVLYKDIVTIVVEKGLANIAFLLRGIWKVNRMNNAGYTSFIKYNLF